MSDTASRNPTSAPQMLADALLRSVTGTSAQLRVTGTNAISNQSEVGLVATTFSEVVLSPVLMRKLRPNFKEGQAPRWEMLVSATSVRTQISALDLPSARALFAMALAVTVAGNDYLIESVASNEAFGQVYLYRLSLRETCTQVSLTGNPLHAYPARGLPGGRLDKDSGSTNPRSDPERGSGNEGISGRKGSVLPDPLFLISCLYAKRKRFLLHGAPHAAGGSQS